MKFLVFSLILFSAINKCYADEVNYAPYVIKYNDLVALKPSNIDRGNVINGLNTFRSRKTNCLSCHEAPIPDEKFQGNFGPSLHGVGSRYSREEIRIRIIDAKILYPNTIMPSYFKILKYPRTPKQYEGKTFLLVEEVEDLVEYLYSLK
ncbi:sulfur oxidation c-type cytochrome SoxX [Alphaproteobacteria bacterium]|nr:sulfur oxidation c-type cytochrome SoxX [Alphaproteobacteria bacterium]